MVLARHQHQVPAPNVQATEGAPEQNNATEQLFRLRLQKFVGQPRGVKKLRAVKLDFQRSETFACGRETAAERAANPVVKSAAATNSNRIARKQRSQT